MSDIKVSIVIPVYNSERYIKQCLDSIISQDFTNLDIIIVDDGSSDNSYKICEKYKNIDLRIRLYRQENKGVSAARNKGISEAVGEYIIFIDSDDYVDSKFVSRMVDNLLKESSDLVITNYKIFNTDTKEIEYNSNRKSELLSSLSFFSNYWTNYHLGYVNAPWNKIYKMDIISEHNLTFPIDISMGEDGYFNVQYLHYCKTIYINNEYLYNFRIHSSQSTKKIFKNHFYMLNKIFDNLENELSKYKLLENKVYADIHYFEYFNELKLSFYYLFKDKSINLSNKITTLKYICKDNRVNTMIKRIKGKTFKDKLFLLFIKFVSLYRRR